MQRRSLATNSKLGPISECNLKPIKRIHMQQRAASAGGHKMY